jgi:hypothetical protein
LVGASARRHSHVLFRYAEGTGCWTDPSRSHAEYQILAFTGGPLLPESERIRRKIITSTVVR